MTKDNTTIIRLPDVGMRHDDKEVLTGVDLDINHGDFLAITGPNGGGKTTLLRIILKLLKPTSGCVEYYDYEGKPAQCLSIGYLPQKNMIDSRFPLTVRDVVASGLLGLKGLSRSDADSAIIENLQLVEMDDRADSAIGRLSGGQLQRVLLARALVARPQLLVMDEPLSYLDKHFEQRVYDILRMKAEHSTIVLVSHEMSIISGMATRHAVVDHHLSYCHAGSHSVHYDCTPN